MTDNSEWEISGDGADQLPRITNGSGQGMKAAGGASGVGQKSNEINSLVLLINTILGGLGILYSTTKSTGITLAAALLVTLITVVVLVGRNVLRPGESPQGEDGRGGE
ncbi:hypothetical protein [Streptomyces sp. CAI-85]|uniref:hypothetical protein n=1 Tax=Streptomyces sp. CAI-85 TaxID=1472662 RepID=UPI001587987C|nr:hypothetical protein [Streptomyces sp. CAI-85]NUV64881.1 hypothetical protein [Streptomyces sp. CAI-85]